MVNRYEGTNSRSKQTPNPKLTQYWLLIAVHLNTLSHLFSG